jgi:hypothetical protein
MFLLRFILLVLFFYLIIKILGRLLFPSGRENRTGSNAYSNPHKSRKEGEVHIDFSSNKKQKIVRKGDGEYIKYEEIKGNDK